MRPSLFFKQQLLCSLILFLLSLVSCESDLPEEGVWSKTPTTFHFSVDKQKIETGSASLNDHLSIKTNADWTASADVSWISLSPSSGKSDAQVSVSITENTTTSDRTGMITIKSLALDSIARISVSQLGKSLSVDQDALTFSNAGETKNVSISAEGNLVVSTSEAWITAKVSGTQLSISVGPNVTSSDRKGSVLVEITGLTSGSLSHEISVLQIGTDYTFSVEKDNVTSSSAAFSDLIVLSTNDEWTISADKDWVAFSSTSGQGDANININVAENKTTEKRTAIVTIAGKYSGKNASISFTQDGKYLTVDPSSLNFSAASGSKIITVSTDGVFAVTKEGDWFSVSTDGNTLTVSTEKNIATTTRTGSITVSMKDLSSGSLSRTIEVYQSAENYTFSVSSNEISASSAPYSTSFSITTNDEWTMSADKSWITLSASSGSGNKSITVSLSDNATASSRSGSITISGVNSGEKATISVKQDGRYLTLSPSSLSFGAEAESSRVTVSTDGTYTTSCSESWLSVSASGSSITISATKNTGTTARSGSVTVSLTDLTSGSLSQKISVTQDGTLYSLKVDKESISVGASSASESFNITSNDSWTASSDASWATLSATSGSGDKSITVSISANSSTTARSGKITVKGTNSDSNKTITVSQKGKSSIDTNGHEYVDLGLPSGLLWATCNVGASNPEDYGDYFAWGENSIKDSYEWSTYKYCKGTRGSLTKYNIYSNYGVIDNKVILDIEDDVAHIKWGGNWHIPAYEDWDELKTECSWTWTTQKGVNGYKVTSKKNNNFLFLPAAGFLHISYLGSANSIGYYWTSSLYTDSPNFAYVLFFKSDNIDWGGNERIYGQSIRSICKPSK